MGTFGEYLKSAISSIRNNKGRSFLTMLGIIIGIAAVLIVLVIGDGVRAEASSQMSDLEVASIDISLDISKTDKFFTPEDLNAIEENMSCLYGVSPSNSIFGTAKGTKGAFNVLLTGGSDVMAKTGNNKILHGRYFTHDDVDECNNVCVISEIAATHLFGYSDAVGEIIEISDGDISRDFTVVGIREDTSMDKAYSTQAGENPILTGDLPYTSACDAYNIDVNNSFTQVTAYTSSDDRDEAISKIKSVVENVMGLRGEEAVSIKTSYGMDDTTSGILNVVTVVITLIASISLVVGGIGVMNIMTVSVTERTREIGIRKSLGARTSSILTQFLAEAAILTFTSGIIGIALGLSIAKIACSVINISFVVNPVLVMTVVGISVGIGLFFGIYPAKRAAKLDPIEALRVE